MTSPRPRRIGVEPAAVPPDAGLQSERTSLSWAWAAAFSALVVVPLLALLRVQRRHEQRVDRFVRAGEVEQTQARHNIGLVALVIVIAACGLVAIVVTSLR